jgi:peptide/nickel transport system substrate-binding protein
MPQQWKVHTPTQETVTPLAVNQDDYMRAVTGGDTAASRNARRYSPAARRSAPRSMQGDLNAGRSLPKETGYAGQKVVILNPTNNIIGPCGQVTYDLLKELGMNVDLQETDWGTVLQRRNSRKPVDVGR